MITRNFNLNLYAGNSSPLVINANQYDRGEQWVFTLYDENGVQYIPSTGAIVGIKSDGLGIINTGSVVDGKVVINETQQMTAAIGKATFELTIDSQTHGTANFIVLVEPKPGDNADLSESDLSLIQQAIDGTSATAIAQGVSDWMDENLTPTTPVVDTSLTVQGAAADSKKVGDEISDLKSQIAQSAGLTSDIKQALMNLANAVAFKGNDPTGQTVIDALEDALYPPVVYTAITLNKSSLSFGNLGSTQKLVATTTPNGGYVTWSSSDTSVATVSQTGVVTSVDYGNAIITATCGSLSATCSVAIAQATVTSISASYTQSGDVYTDTSLDDLKADLVVTATYDNEGTSVVPPSDYTLSGTLEVGTSTVAVSYNGVTTTFNVAVTAKLADGAYAIWDARDYTTGQTWSDRISNIALTPTGSPAKTNGAVVLDGTAKYFSFGSLSVPVAPTVVTIQVAFKLTDLTKLSFIIADDRTQGSQIAIILRPQENKIRVSANGNMDYSYTFDEDWHLLTAVLGGKGQLIYIDDTFISRTQNNINNPAERLNTSTDLKQGAFTVYNGYANMNFRSLYIYPKKLSELEIANNYSFESNLWE